jgi:hypothetical protein
MVVRPSIIVVVASCQTISPVRPGRPLSQAAAPAPRVRGGGVDVGPGQGRSDDGDGGNAVDRKSGPPVRPVDIRGPANHVAAGGQARCVDMVARGSGRGGEGLDAVGPGGRTTDEDVALGQVGHPVPQCGELVDAPDGWPQN